MKERTLGTFVWARGREQVVPLATGPGFLAPRPKGGGESEGACTLATWERAGLFMFLWSSPDDAGEITESRYTLTDECRTW